MSDRLYRLLRRFVEIRREEAPVVGWCWLFIFAVLSSYYIMRPIRDEAGVAGGVNNLQWLFTGTLLGMVLLNIPFAFLVKKLPRRRFIPITYHFFAINIVVFAALLHWADAQQTVWIGRIFFIWVSVYNLFVVSVFWQLNVDLFSPEQSKRLFGLIAAGASIGAIVGSSVTAGLARHVSPIFLLLGAAVLLEIAVFSVGRLSRLSPALHRGPAAPAADEAPIGGSIFAGITRAFGSRYLVNVSLFVLLFTVTSTILYFQQAGIVSHSISGRGAQTAFFATVDLCVNILTLAIQLFLTGRIVVLLGVALTLGLLPVLTIIGFSALALMPTIAAVAVFQVLRRAGDYAITRPTREVLFTVVPREDRYKAKSFIDTVVYRAGDQIGAWSVALLRGAVSAPRRSRWWRSPCPLVARGRAVALPSSKTWPARAALTKPSRPDRVKNRAIDLSHNGERTAHVAVPLRPSGTMLQQPLIGGRRLLMALAIAEQPRAEIGDRLLSGLQSKGGAGAIERFLTPIAVVESLAQTAIERSPLVVRHFALAEHDAAGIEVSGTQRALSGSLAQICGRYFEGVAQLYGTLDRASRANKPMRSVGARRDCAVAPHSAPSIACLGRRIAAGEYPAVSSKTCRKTRHKHVKSMCFR